jgi:hypothetical protein
MSEMILGNGGIGFGGI